jgi:myo-inositol-1-phosphate synthase
MAKKKNTSSVNPKVRVAIIGVGNCASSLVQGLNFISQPRRVMKFQG